MIIEFLGVSGVGKTTIAKQYKGNLESEGKIVVWDTYALYAKQGWLKRNFRKSINVLLFSASHPKWVKEYKNYLKSEIASKEERRKPLFNGIFLKSLLVVARKDTLIHLFDEGVFQNLWAIKQRSRKNVSNNDIDKIRLLFGYPNQLVVVEASPEIIMNRIKTRGAYVHIMESNDLMTEIERMLIIQKEIVRRISSVVDTNIINNN